MSYGFKNFDLKNGFLEIGHFQSNSGHKLGSVSKIRGRIFSCEISRRFYLCLINKIMVLYGFWSLFCVSSYSIFKTKKIRSVKRRF